MYYVSLHTCRSRQYIFFHVAHKLFYLQLILVQAKNTLIIFKWPELQAHKRPLIKLGKKSVVDKVLSAMVWGYDFLLQPFIFYSRQFLWLVYSPMHLWPPCRWFLSIKVSQKRQWIKLGALTRVNKIASSKQNTRIQMICKWIVDRQHFYEVFLSPVRSFILSLLSLWGKPLS